MPVVLTDIAQLQARHLARFASVLSKARQESIDAGGELMTILVSLHSGSPVGAAREAALIRDDHPFARRHGRALWSTPPVGIISGKLVNSLRVELSSPSIGVFSNVGKSVGVDYAAFLWSPNGTRTMVSRGVSQAVSAFATARVIKMGRDLMAYQMRLI